MGRIRTLLLVVLVISPVNRIQAQTATRSTETVFTAAPLYRDVVDETGRSVHVPQPVRRIVSLAPSVTETIYALGLQDRLVGDTDFCDFPADAQKKTKVGGAINPSLEVIAHLKPDLVLVTRHLNSLDTVHSLDALGIPYYATDPRSVDQIISSTKKLSDVLGVPEAGAAVAQELQRRLAELKAKIGALPPSRVLFIVWSDPLISIGKHTFIADALRRAGAVSIVDSSQSWPQVNLEEVLRLQPEFLIFADAHGEDTPRNFEALSIRPAWRNLHAVQERHFAVISDAVNRPAPRIVSAIEQLAEQLHPEAFGDKSAAPKPVERPAIEKPRGAWRSSEVIASAEEAKNEMRQIELGKENITCAR